MTVTNEQTAVTYLGVLGPSNALAALPASPWPAGGFTLSVLDDEVYEPPLGGLAVAEVNPTTIDASGPTAATPLTIQRDPLSGDLPRFDGLAAAAGVQIHGVTDVTVDGIDVRNAPTLLAGVFVGNYPLNTIGASAITLRNLRMQFTGNGRALWAVGSVTPSSDIVLEDSQLFSSLSGHVQLEDVDTSAAPIAIRRCISSGCPGASVIYILNATGTEPISFDRVFVQTAAGRVADIANSTSPVVVTNSVAIHNNRSALAAQLFRVDNSDLRLYFSTVVHDQASSPGAIAAVVDISNMAAAGNAAESNIFYLSGNNGEALYRFAADSDALALIQSRGNCARLVDLGGGTAPVFARVTTPATTYTTRAVWNTFTGHDAAPVGAGGRGSIDSDPLFNNITFPATDARIASTSPARNIAFNDNAGVTTDYFGTARPQGSGFDAGAHESIFAATNAIRVTPTSVERHGGFRVSFSGAPLTDGRYTVYVGATGTDADAPAYAGAYGNGNLTLVTSGAGVFVSPPLPSGGPYRLFFDGDGGQARSEPVLRYVNQNYRSSVYGVRRFPSWYDTGPRSVDQEPPQ